MIIDTNARGCHGPAPGSKVPGRHGPVPPGSNVGPEEMYNDFDIRWTLFARSH